MMENLSNLRDYSNLSAILLQLFLKIFLGFVQQVESRLLSKLLEITALQIICSGAKLRR